MLPPGQVGGTGFEHGPIERFGRSLVGSRGRVETGRQEEEAEQEVAKHECREYGWVSRKGSAMARRATRASRAQF
jgi:hypothetical protein